MQQYRKNLGKVSLTAEGVWDNSKQYAILSIVYDEHTQHGFISKKEVPSGVDLYNKEYWMPLNVSGYADNNVIILSKKTSEASIQSYTLEEAIASIKSVGRRPGAILGFYNENNDRLDIGGRWELWQFNSTTISEWEDVKSWTNIYYNYNKFVGWYKSEDYLKKHFPFPEIGCYAFVGSELNEASVYRCDNKYVWNNTTQHAWDYIKVIVDGNVTVGKNGNWFNNGEDTGIPASVKGENGKTPIIRNNNNVLEVSYDNVNWESISDEIAVWLRVNNNKLEMTKNKSGGWEVVSDYISAWFRWQSDGGEQITSVGKIQITRDGVNWIDLSGNFVNHLRISRYIGAGESLPTSGIAEGTIYAKGPTYDTSDTSHTNPIYRLWVYAWKDNTLAWQDNGEFTSIAAGVVQETGNSETEVMSQKVVTEKLSELGSNLGISLVWEQGTIEDGTSGIPAGIVNDVGRSRICSSTKFIVGTEIIYSVPEGYHLAISDWDGITSTITHKSGWVNGDGKWIVENVNVFFIMSKGSKVTDIDISEGELIDLYVSDSIALMLNQHFIQEGLSDTVDIDNAKNGVLSFTSASVPIGLPNLDYGSGAIVLTNRKSNKTLGNWDLQYIITKNNIASRVYFNGIWDNWGVREYGTLRYNKYASFAANALNVLNDLDNAHLDVIYKLVIVDGYVPNNLPNDYPLSGVDAWLESKKTYYSGNSYTINQRINFDALDYFYTREYNSDGNKWSVWRKRYYTSTNDITITIGENGQYKTLREGMSYACSLKSAKVIVEEGIYDLTKEFADVISNPIEGNMGIELKNDVHVIFKPGAYVKAILPLNNTLRTYFNPFFMAGSFVLEGLNIEVANTRYCVHDEGAGRYKVKTTYRNCTMKNHSDIYIDATGEHCFYQCIGGGMGLHHEVEIQNCYFESMKGDSSDVAAVSYHNGYSERCDGKIFVSNSYFAFNNTFSVQYYGNSTIKTRAFVNNCSLGKPLITKAEIVDSTIVNMEILEFNNTVRE